MDRYSQIVYSDIEYGNSKLFGGQQYELNDQDIGNARTPPPEAFDQIDELGGLSLNAIQNQAYQMEFSKSPNLFLDDPIYNSIGEEDPLAPQPFLGDHTYPYKGSTSECSSAQSSYLAGEQYTNLGDSMSRISLNANDDYEDPKSVASSSASVSSSETPGRTRTSLANYTEAEKYLRQRDQNNVASKKYRSRTKAQRQTNKESLRELEVQNSILKAQKAGLESSLRQCIVLKDYLERNGYPCPFPSNYPYNS